ncbi:aminoglycoside phosphotransferase family protein [Actinoplanes sp. NBRC 101535]|uniref:aminoglycoside phosphotransferase family protein n=1 Tax=Actinoplanes sp. NBRC 101535 TaxID=3032196 RepID=UPI0024A531BF|nr:aminoglycoside phosphotransferase family protein [Actinoplanes sp. NBRC 101535]GLY07032.1 hypothetical protein Acsp01_74110 [Actinoplanes sp. NBRC 101535]
MLEPPQDVDDAAVLAALAAGWGVRAGRADYLPVGAGSHHWTADGLFLKVDRESAAVRRSLETARALRLDFVLAPLPTRDGGILQPVAPGWTMAAFPLVDGVAGEFGPHPPEDRPEIAAMLTELHRSTPRVAHLAPRIALRLPGRNDLLTALAESDRPWTSGPQAEPARALLRRHADRLHGWLADFDRLTATLPPPDAWVVTHGEPHPGNVLRTADGLTLIDWTTVGIAPPDRDLWMLTDAFADLATPVREPSPVAFYQLGWILADVAAFTADLRRPHGDGPDEAAALRYLGGYLEG